MNDNLEDRISRLLETKADPISGSDTLASNARRKVRRVVVQRCVTAGVAGVAALAVVVPVGLDVVNRDQITPTDTEPVTLELPIRELPKGEPPAVPYHSDGVIHDGSARIPVPEPGKRDSITDVQSAGDGYLVTYQTTSYEANGSTNGSKAGEPASETNETRLVDAAGQTLRTLSGEVPNQMQGPVVSADGRRVAWSDWNEDKSATVRVADTSTGDTIAERPMDGKYPRPTGFVGDRVVISDNGKGSATLWDPEADAASTLDAISEVEGTDGQSVVLARIADHEPGSRRFGGYDVDTGKFRWRLPESEFDPDLVADGQYLMFDARLNSRYRDVYDMATGQKLLRIDRKADDEQVIGWIAGIEPDGALLLEVSEGLYLQAVVRCTLSGECERASDLEMGSDPPWTL